MNTTNQVWVVLMESAIDGSDRLIGEGSTREAAIKDAFGGGKPSRKAVIRLASCEERDEIFSRS
jgi:hypothetical protein